MNTLAADAPIHRPRSVADHDPALPPNASQPSASALWLSGGVTALALLSFFVQVLDEPTQRTQLQLQAQLRAATVVDATVHVPAPTAGQRMVQTAVH